MDYTCESNYIFVERTRNDREKQADRLLAYAALLNKRLFKKINKLYKKVRWITFWDKESGIEQTIYMNMKKWESRHPIIAIILCTILGGILISLIAGIILEAGINSFI